VDHPLSFLLAAVVCLGTAFYIAAPLRRGRSEQPAARSSAAEDRATLMARRDALLHDLKDLEFDRNTGKIGDNDYNEMRAATAEAASTVLQQLETNAQPLGAARRRLELEAEVEVLIARARRGLTRAPLAAPSNGALPQAVLTAAFQAGGWACAACGRVMGKHDRFCASCGATRSE